MDAEIWIGIIKAEHQKFTYIVDYSLSQNKSPHRISRSQLISTLTRFIENIINICISKKYDMINLMMLI
jgi:hypothetical protein